MPKINPKYFLIILAILATVFACGKSKYPANVEQALVKAGANRDELEKTLSYYSSWDDTLKLKAAYYLIGNMEDHCYSIAALYDSTKKEIPFNVNNYKSFEELEKSFDSLETIYGALDFKKDTLVNDLETIKSEYLINQIDFAFQAWRTKAWAVGLPYNDFLEYVLPYRGSNEPLEPWREYFWEKYNIVTDSLFKDTPDPIQVAGFINDDIKTWFTFDPRFYYHPTDQGLAEMLANHLGRCEDMTNVTIYAMRAMGLAVTSDYTPFWANSGGNHAWNALVLPDGKVIPFMGAESNPGQYKLANKMAKVYRKMYAEQKDNLAFQENKQAKVPGWLAGKNYIDVTAAYTDVCDVAVNFEKAIPDSVDYGYLCVFNSGEWQAIDWARIIGDSSRFRNFGVGIVYLPALYLNEEIVPYGTPFILKDDCSLQSLKADLTKTRSLDLISATERKLAISTDGVNMTGLETGTTYELFYWDDSWQSLGKQTATENGLSFNNVPENSLYWLTKENSDKDERIFTIENNQQIWW